MLFSKLSTVAAALLLATATAAPAPFPSAPTDLQVPGHFLSCALDNIISGTLDASCPNDALTTLPTTPSSPANTLINILTPSSIISLTTGTLLTPAYAHGVCSFTLHLTHQCLFNPTEAWHTEMFGHLPSIEDAGRKPVVRYPNGAGRIDGRIKLLTGMGNGLYLTYYTDGKVYFRWDNGQWDTGTPDDGVGAGLCHWGAWSREGLECRAENGGMLRLSDVTCVFRC